MVSVKAIELLFRELKTGYRLDHMPSKSPHVVFALIHAALLTLAVPPARGGLQEDASRDKNISGA